MKKILFLIGVLMSLSFRCFSQSGFQTVRGTVVDKISQAPLPDVKVQVLNLTPMIAAMTDSSGNFSLKEVPVGAQSLKISVFGYKELTLQNLSVNAGKELVLNIQMEEEVTNLKEVSAKANFEKNKALNEMSAVSTRTFSVEETQKFAAAVNDPARMATSFAGVVTADDGNNHISIRGNSPNGLLWRMEGVDIPNPNHFSSIGSSGGGISILSSQLLSNSDFSTGAFAAEYGNALSGVFDLHLRKGNNQKREYTIQTGFLGLDIAAEGPFKQGYAGSYLINYRYSTLSLLGKIGVPLGDAITNFQDLSYHLYLPTQKAGNFSLFGFTGLSYQKEDPVKDSLVWEVDPGKQYKDNFYSNTGAYGVTHFKLFKNRSYLKTALVFSGTENGFYLEKLQTDYSTLETQYRESYLQSKWTLSSSYTRKWSSKTSLRSGFIINRLNYKLKEEMLEDGSLRTYLNSGGNTYTLQAYAQLQQKIGSKLTGNIGVHYLHLFLNNTYSLEPRASLKYKLTNRQNVTLGYGLHSQVQTLAMYFIRNEATEGIQYPNKNLDLNKAHHLVLAYDIMLNAVTHLKIESYYQHLFQIPISADSSLNYCSLNQLDGYSNLAMTNGGIAKNYGLELTFERYLSKGFYYLLSASLFESKYKFSDQKWYNTRYNTNYSVVLTLGKEWTLSEKRKSRIIGFNIKAMFIGGLRYTSSNGTLQQDGSWDISYGTPYANQVPDYSRIDTRVSVKRNYKQLTTTLALDFQNTTNRKNIGGQYFDTFTGTQQYWYQTPLIPVLSYRLEF